MYASNFQLLCKQYETYLKEQKAKEDIHLRDREQGFVSMFFDTQTKNDRYEQAYQILKDKAAKEKLIELRKIEEGAPSKDPLINPKILSSLPAETKSS